MVKTCRICLKKAPIFFCIRERLRSVKYNITVMQALKVVVPELSSEFSTNAVICTHCHSQLQISYQFKLKCRQTEEMLNKYFKDVDKSGIIDLDDLQVIEMHKQKIVICEKKNRPSKSNTSTNSEKIDPLSLVQLSKIKKNSKKLKGDETKLKILSVKPAKQQGPQIGVKTYQKKRRIPKKAVSVLNVSSKSVEENKTECRVTEGTEHSSSNKNISELHACDTKNTLKNQNKESSESNGINTTLHDKNLSILSKNDENDENKKQTTTQGDNTKVSLDSLIFCTEDGVFKDSEGKTFDSDGLPIDISPKRKIIKPKPIEQLKKISNEPVLPTLQSNVNENMIEEDLIEIKEEPLDFDENDLYDSNVAKDTPETLPTENKSNNKIQSPSKKQPQQDLDGILDKIPEVNDIQFDMPEYVHVRKVQYSEFSKLRQKEQLLKKNIKQEPVDVKQSPVENTKKVTARIKLNGPIKKLGTGGVKRKRRTKRLRLVPVELEEVTPAKKAKHGPDRNVVVLFTNFTELGEYINDHDYLQGPYIRNNLLQKENSESEKWTCHCLICGSVHDAASHVEHMRLHETKCKICKVDFKNVYYLNLHVKVHSHECECGWKVGYNNYEQHNRKHGWMKKKQTKNQIKDNLLSEDNKHKVNPILEVDSYVADTHSEANISEEDPLRCDFIEETNSNKVDGEIEGNCTNVSCIADTVIKKELPDVAANEDYSMLRSALENV